MVLYLVALKGSAGYIHVTLKSSELLVASKSCQAAKLSLQPAFGLQNSVPTEEPKFALDSVSPVMRNIVHINKCLQDNNGFPNIGHF